MDADLNAYLDTMQTTLTQQIAQLNAEARKDLTAELTQQIASVRQEARQLSAGTRRELGTLIEEAHDQVKLLAEAVASNNDRLGALLTDHERRIVHLEERRGCCRTGPRNPTKGKIL